MQITFEITTQIIITILGIIEFFLIVFILIDRTTDNKGKFNLFDDKNEIKPDNETRTEKHLYNIWIIHFRRYCHFIRLHCIPYNVWHNRCNTFHIWPFNRCPLPTETVYRNSRIHEPDRCQKRTP